MTDPPPTAPRYLGGRYRLDRIIGRGSMGRVWSAFDEWLTRWVAIKEVVFPPNTPGAERELVTERAMREARAIATVTDPHVVIIFDLVATEASPAIVMELLDAQSLAQILASEKVLDEPATAAIGFGVASALLAAHAVGITHRDVKPGNVLLAKDGRVKLTDFGIARSIAETTMTATGLLLGSPAYISPEVAAGEVATPASDAWGLGGLLYAGITGNPPYDAGDPLKTLFAVVNDPAPVPPPNAGRLDGLIRALLTKDPKRRMTTAQAQVVLRGIADESVSARLATRLWAPAAPVLTAPAPGSRTATGLPNRPAVATGSSRVPVPTAPARPTAPAPRPATGPAPIAPASTVSRPFVSLAGPATPPAPDDALPPPPWAAQGTGKLRPLPAASHPDRRPTSMTTVRWWLVIVVAVLAVVIGYLAVRGIHEIVAGWAVVGTSKDLG